jgi:hypothetical protein
MARSPTVVFAALAVSALTPVTASAEPLPLRIDYQAAPGCPGADVFFEEIRWRTRLARAAEPWEEALPVSAHVARRGAASVGHLVLGHGEARVTRDLESNGCDEVVSALALVTALAIDPRARTEAKRPSRSSPEASPETAPMPPASPPIAPAPPPLPAGLPLPPSILADPLPDLPQLATTVDEVPAAPAAMGPRWLVGARATVAGAVAPRALFGGGLFADRAFEGRWSPTLRLAAEIAGTGAFDAGPGGASFLRGIVRLDGCAFPLRTATARLSLVPCIAVEGGAIHAEGILMGSLAHVDQTTVPWVAGGVLPRLSVEAGAVTLEVQGGPVFPAVRRSFVFETPSYVIGTLPAATWTVAAGAGARFP